MPPKPENQNEDTVALLWACLKNSNYEKIDFHAVGEALNIKSGAASKRFSRFKQRMDAEAGGGSSTPATPSKGEKRTAEEPGLEGEADESPTKKKKASAKGKSAGKGKGKGKTEGDIETKVKEEATSGNEMEDGEGEGNVFD